MLIRRTALLLLLACFAPAAQAAEPSARPFLHPLFADGMVLQRDAEVPVWGWCPPGQRVAVAVAGQTATATADAAGRWEARVGPLAADGKAVEITVTGPRTVTVKDVLVGDVWVCSGQSNMQGNLDRANNAAAIAVADHPGIRFLSHIPGNEDVGTEIPLEVFGLTKGQWQPVTPKSADKLSRVAYFFGKDLHERTRVPIGLIVVALNGSPIESWMPRESLLSLPSYEVGGHFYAADDPFNEIIPHWHLPCVRYNSLIAPLAPFGLKGFLWYQGETNAAWRQSDDRYTKLLQLMIRGWRAAWGGEEIPFVTVQLPSTPKSKEMSSPIRRSGWAEVQAAQAKSLALPKTAVAVCMDLGDGDLHPKTKDKIGARAALAARQVAYGESIVGMGPTFKAVAFDNGAVRVSFENVGGGLVSKDGEPLRFFALAGEDRRFVWADAKLDGNAVIVSSPKVPKPVAVRYGWVPTGLVNLFNKEGLPASPFRTDSWDDDGGKQSERLRGPDGKGVLWDGKAIRSPLAPLAWEVQQGRATGVKAYLDAHPNAVKEANAARSNLINVALTLKSSDVARLLLDSGADPNLPDLAGLFPIHKAAMHGHTDVVELLLAAGADPKVETRNPGRATPLFFACQFDRTAAARLLLEKGADVEVGRQFYRAGSGIEPHTPLYAAFDKTKDGATAALLIERGAKLDRALPSGDEVLHVASRKNLPQVIEALVKKSVDVNRPSAKKATPLEVAAEAGAKEAVELLLKKGATVTPAALAAANKKGDPLVLDLLKKAK